MSYMVIRGLLHWAQSGENIMRPIIQRTVIIVITTTWTISWQEDAIHSDPKADHVAARFPESDELQKPMQRSRESEATSTLKEADLLETELMTNPIAAEPLEDPNQLFYQLKGIEKS